MREEAGPLGGPDGLPEGAPLAQQPLDGLELPQPAVLDDLGGVAVSVSQGPGCPQPGPRGLWPPGAPLCAKGALAFFFFFKRFTYLFMRDTQREAETQAEGEAGSRQGAQRGTRSRDPRITPKPKVGFKPLGHPGVPGSNFLLGVWKTRIPFLMVEA